MKTKRRNFSLCILYFALPPFLLGAAEKVSFKAPDGATFNAIFVKPSPGKPTVIMLHGLASVKEEWQPLIAAASKNGIGALAYDARPAGTPWNQLVNDVGAAVRFLEEKKKIDRTSLILAGASLGANVCLKYRALASVGRGVILLSPGLNYQGLTTEDIIKKVGRTPLLFVAHPADGYAYQSSLTLVPLAANAKLWTSLKPGHGVQMFDEDLLNRLAQWTLAQK